MLLGQCCGFSLGAVPAYKDATFCLLVFRASDIGGSLGYTSGAEREETIQVLEALLQKLRKERQ